MVNLQVIILLHIIFVFDELPQLIELDHRLINFTCLLVLISYAITAMLILVGVT